MEESKAFPDVYANLLTILTAAATRLSELESQPIEFMIDLMHQCSMVNWHFQHSEASAEARRSVEEIYRKLRHELLYFFDIVSTTR